MAFSFGISIARALALQEKRELVIHHNNHSEDYNITKFYNPSKYHIIST